MQNQNIIIGLYTNPRVFLVLVLMEENGKKNSLAKFFVVVCWLFCVLSLHKTWRNAKVGMFANVSNQ